MRISVPEAGINGMHKELNPTECLGVQLLIHALMPAPGTKVLICHDSWPPLTFSRDIYVYRDTRHPIFIDNWFLSSTFWQLYEQFVAIEYTLTIIIYEINIPGMGTMKYLVGEYFISIDNTTDYVCQGNAFIYMYPQIMHQHKWRLTVS